MTEEELLLELDKIDMRFADMHISWAETKNLLMVRAILWDKLKNLYLENKITIKE